MVNVPIQIALALAPVVPEILRWITGDDKSKAAEVAEQVVDVAERVTGKFGMEAAEAVRADPKLMIQFRTRVLEIDAELDKAYLADRQNARQRDIELARAGQRNQRADNMVRWAALGTGGGFLAMLVLGVIKARYPAAINEGVFGALLAQIATITSFFGLCLRDAYQYEFGSSRGSANKQADLQAVLDRLSAPKSP